MRRRLAVISDVHANLAALRAVLADLDAHGAEEIVVAGDAIGFGPHPGEVVDLLRERGARMIRGNHEKDYVARYDAPDRPADWAASPRLRSFRWGMERLGRERRAFLAALPDSLMLDDDTLVIHGSPRSARDAVLPWSTDEELEAMYAGHPSRLVFMGHTHRLCQRPLPTRRLVNVGSVGMPLDGDPRATYVMFDGSQITPRRVPYDVPAHLAAFDATGLAACDPLYAEVMRRQHRNGRDYYGPWFKYSHDVPDAEVDAAMARYLADNP